MKAIQNRARPIMSSSNMFSPTHLFISFSTQYDSDKEFIAGVAPGEFENYQFFFYNRRNGLFIRWVMFLR
jgi:hypothetical protein